MAITFPRELPDVSYTDLELSLDAGVTASESRGRLVNYTQHSAPLWRVTLTTQFLANPEFAKVEAWWLSLRDGLNRAVFKPLHALYPVAHRVNTPPADDAGVVVSGSSGNVLFVSAVDTDLVLNPGDFLGLERASKFYLGQITDVSGTGTTRSITVEPMPFATVAQAGAVVRFAKPQILMRPIPSSFTVTRTDGFMRSATFSLVECD